MFFKLIVVIAVIYIVYRIFFKKSDVKSQDETTMIECSSCSVFIVKKEMVKLGDKYICRDCMKEHG